MDTIELSNRPIKPTLSKIRDSIVSDIKKDKDPGTLDNLKTQLESGQYQINSSDLAKLLISTNND